MSRPRKAEDPIRWPVPCNRCGQHHQTVARWPDGGVCGYCYQQAKRTRGICACGHEGVLPGFIDNQAACRRCSGIRLNIDCESCGAEDELHSGGRCWACVLGNVVDDLLTDPATGAIANDLIPLAAALKSMKRANSGMTWIRQNHVTAFLRNLAVAPQITHEVFDELPDSRTREYVRGLLTEHGVLPQRDELRIRYNSWAAQALERVSDPQNREVIRRYIRWHHQRRMNHMDEVTRGTFLRAKQEVTVALPEHHRGDRAGEVVVPDVLGRDASQDLECFNVSLQESFLRLRGIDPVDGPARVREPENKHVALCLHTVQHHPDFTEIHLRLRARGVFLWDKHLHPAAGLHIDLGPRTRT